MSRETYNYRRFCMVAIKDLLVKKERETVDYYLTLAREMNSVDELSKLMTKVREII